MGGHAFPVAFRNEPTEVWKIANANFGEFSGKCGFFWGLYNCRPAVTLSELEVLQNTSAQLLKIFRAFYNRFAKTTMKRRDRLLKSNKFLKPKTKVWVMCWIWSGVQFYWKWNTSEVFFCEFYESFQNRHSIEHLWMKAEWKLKN